MYSKGKVAFHTLGCKLNFAETSTISRILEKEGLVRVPFDEAADIYVINTCSVTEQADKECRQVVRKALRNSPEAHIIVIGCYAQLKPEEISTIAGVDLVLGAKEKFNIGHYLKTLPEKKSAKGAVYSCDISDVNLFESSYSYGERTRAFLKVQDGCDYSCTYCTIPLARGKSRSDTINHVVAQATLLSELGVKEIVLTGVNIGDFGISNENEGDKSSANGKRIATFFQLIRQLDDITGIERFRISSIEPNLLTDEIIEFIAESKRFMPHFHIPLQSGSDIILKRMKRRYLSHLYQERVLKIKSLMPHCCIGVDVIAGFPGENDTEFLKTYDFLNRLDISYLHVFTYSERDNTDAIKFDGVVPMNVRYERNKRLRILSEKKKRKFYEGHLGDRRRVLFESETTDGHLEGYSDNYIRVMITGNKNIRGKICSVQLNELNDGFAWGTVAQLNLQEPVTQPALLL